MSVVSPEVAQVIKHFVAREQSFISLDVYCKLGQHFDIDAQNPIHEQVRAAYGTDMMPNYLCKWVSLKLEGGGVAECWKYYLPKTTVQKFDLFIRQDGTTELTKKVLGQFSLLECDFGVRFESGKITFALVTEPAEELHITNASKRLLLSKKILKMAELDAAEKLAAFVYSNKIEVVAG
jgi:hypothetical protein